MAKKTKKNTSVSTDHCVTCEAACCKYVATEIDEPTCKRDYDNIRWYLMHRDVYVFVCHEGSWYLEFETPCENLGKDHLCHRYEERPRICREHGDENRECEFFGHKEPHAHRFSTTEEFEAWLEEKGREWRWKSWDREVESKSRKVGKSKRAKDNPKS